MSVTSSETIIHLIWKHKKEEKKKPRTIPVHFSSKSNFPPFLSFFWFILLQKLKLRYESRNPNFFEMFIENPHTNFKLSLTKEDEPQPVWTCVIRKGQFK